MNEHYDQVHSVFRPLAGQWETACRSASYRGSATGRLVMCLGMLLTLALGARAAAGESQPRSTWPQSYSVVEDEDAGALILSTPYYTVEHDLRKGGAIRRIALTNGKAGNLLLLPMGTRVVDEAGTVMTDLRDSAPEVAHRQEGRNVIVTVDSALADSQGHVSGLRVKSTFTYRWGYVKIHKEFLVPAGGLRVKELCVLSTVLTRRLSEYGYREGITEEEGAPPFSFGRNRWAHLRGPSDPPLQTRYVPRSMIFVDPGIEGLEWFVSSDLWQWDLQLTGRRGQGRCLFELSGDPPGIALSISPLWSPDKAAALPQSCVFDYYLAVPLREKNTRGPWLHTSFNRNRGKWVSAEQIRRWAEKGIQTVHCHNDGDYYGDGLFWRDGSYPPYPDMDRYDKVLEQCRRVGIRTATYFSNKELHPSTKEFQQHGETWGRKNRKGELRHNFYRPNREFGAQMCLRSGWLDFLKFSIDRVLKHHRLDGVYYDWNVALLCYNPLHEGKHHGSAAAIGHWDIDELLELMEWTRNRVGPDGLVIVHNTAVPMFATENFADYVVACEWGYGKWTEGIPSLQDLPLEWSLAGARPRGVISYGVLDSKAPRRLHRVFALEAFLGGSTPWPASPETFELFSLLKPLGKIDSYRFADWRNRAVTLSDARCASAIYSRPGEAYLFLANLDQSPRQVTCTLHPAELPHPLAHLSTAAVVATSAAGSGNPDQANTQELDADRLIGKGLDIEIPGDGAIVIRVSQ